MLVRDQPLAVDLLVPIRYAHRQLRLLAFLVRRRDGLNAVSVRHIPANVHRQVVYLEHQRPGIRREHVVPILLVSGPSGILPRRGHIENHQVVARRIERHDRVRVLGIERRSELIFEHPNRRLIRRAGICHRRWCRSRVATCQSGRQRCTKQCSPIHHRVFPPEKLIAILRGERLRSIGKREPEHVK